jgi:D-alanyl-D-alanine carboxypeptidase (penicillin-binding protein 5/6)
LAETPNPNQSTAKAACILEVRSGRVLYAWNAAEEMPMASTTKVMTAMVALEYGQLDDIVTTSTNAYGVPGTSMYLMPGEQRTLEEMLYGLMLVSGNDAAVAIAEHIGGTLEGFYELMNNRALSLGAVHTHFASPNGLPTADHYTTAEDLARIAAAAMRIPMFREIVSTQRTTLPWEGHTYNRVLSNKNRLLAEYPGATGIKTGYTRAAGRCLVFGAVRNGMEVVGVVLNCSDWFDEAERLMDLAFTRYTSFTALAAGETAAVLPVDGGARETVRILVKGDLAAPLAANETPRVVLDLPERVRAPLAVGMPVGVAKLYAGDTLILQKVLVAGEGVPSQTFGDSLQRILTQWPLLAPEPSGDWGTAP